MTPLAQIIALLGLSFVIGWVSRLALRKSRSGPSPSGASRNLGSRGRFLRIALGMGLIVLGIVTGEALWMLCGGFTLYEALSGWCALNAVIGVNSCSIR